MLELTYSIETIAILIVIALLVGFNKTALPALGLFILTMLMLLFSPRTAIGLMLPLLMVADIYAIIAYRKWVDWKRLLKLFPWVLVGLTIGYVTLRLIDESHLKIMIGTIILLFIGMMLLRRNTNDKMLAGNHQALLTTGFGVFGGFSTTVGNAGGEVMSVYLLLQRLPKAVFVGTVAYFFFVVNWIKLPLYWNLGLINGEMLQLTLYLSLFIFLGASIGKRVLPHMKQKRFNQLILFLTLLGAINLFF